MNKKEVVKTRKSKYDDTEDLTIKKVAYDNGHSILFYILLFVFIITLCFTSWKIASKFANKYSKDTEVIKVNKGDNNVLIVNNGEISQKIDKNSFLGNKKEIVIERINSIELKANKNTNKKAKILYDLKYSIKKNSFERNFYGDSKSPLLVRFSYSTDKKNWTYINNVISTIESTISPLSGNNYDISGVISNLSVITNKELECEKNSSNKIYWRSETIFQADDNDNKREFIAEFKIEYKNGIE